MRLKASANLPPALRRGFAQIALLASSPKRSVWATMYISSSSRLLQTKHCCVFAIAKGFRRYRLASSTPLAPTRQVFRRDARTRAGGSRARRAQWPRGCSPGSLQGERAPLRALAEVDALRFVGKTGVPAECGSWVAHTRFCREAGAARYRSARGGPSRSVPRFA
jgi:hypothetical protein